MIKMKWYLLPASARRYASEVLGYSAAFLLSLKRPVSISPFEYIEPTKIEEFASSLLELYILGTYDAESFVRWRRVRDRQ